MAKDNDPWARFRERQEKQESGESTQTTGISIRRPGEIRPEKDEPSTEIKSAIDEFVRRGEILLEQVQNLYQMYAAGQERTPPVALRKQLDDLCQKIFMAPKPTPAARFQVTQFQAKVAMYQDRWTKLLKDLESGKMKRRS